MQFKLFSMAALLLLTNNLFAQPTIPVAPKTKKELNHEKINSIVNAKNAIAKKTRGASRLTAKATSFFNGITFELNDSTAYSYLSNYGYDPTFFEIFQNDFSPAAINNKYQNYFDANKTWDFSMGTPALNDSTNCGFVSNHKRSFERTEYLAFPYTTIQHTDYDANENISVQFDSVMITGSTSYSKYSFTYNAANKLLSIDLPIWNNVSNSWEPDMMDSIFYDAANNFSMIKVYQYNTGSSTWEKSELYNYSYNAANSVTLEIDQTWNAGTSSWDNDYKLENSYDGTNRLLSTTTSMYNTGWELDSKDSFNYAAATLPTTYTNLGWNGTSWDNVNKNSYSYNASNQITTKNGFTWDDVSSIWTDANSTRYYYENYTPQGLTETEAISGNMTIYPVPADNVLNVQADWNEAQSSTLTVTDITGKIVYTMTCPASKQAVQKINLTTFKAGIYTITMKGEHGLMTQKFTKK